MKDNWISRIDAQQTKDETSLAHFLHLITHHILALILFAVIFGTIGFISSEFLIKPQYTATAQILVNQRHTKNAEVFDNQQADIQMVNTYKKIITNHKTLSQSSYELANSKKLDRHYNVTAGALAKSISVKTSQNSQIFELQAKSNNANESADIANTVTNVFKNNIKSTMGFDNIKVTSKAVVPSKPSFPNVKLFTLGGVLLGLMCGLMYTAEKR